MTLLPSTRGVPVDWGTGDGPRQTVEVPWASDSTRPVASLFRDNDRRRVTGSQTVLLFGRPNGPRMFSRLSIPTPFQVGPVNAYLAGRTIIDPGPDSEESWEALAAGLADHDLEPGDLDRALITHPHPDHFGAARRLREAGVEILA